MKRSWLMEATEVSLNARMNAVRTAVSSKFNNTPGCYYYPEAIFDSYVILSKDGMNGVLWWVDYTVDSNGAVSLGEPVEAKYAKVAEGVVFGPMADTDQGGLFRATESEAKPTGKKWGVVIIQEGMSKNRNRYGRKALQEAAHLYEGAAVYVDHEENESRRYGRSLKDKAGFLKNVDGVVLFPNAKEAAAQGVFALAATAVITKVAVRNEMLEAWEEGNPDFCGLSHDAMTEAVVCMGEDGRPFADVRKIESVASVDLVTNAAAGGRIMRLVASDTVPQTLQGEFEMLQKMIEAIKASGNAALIAKLEALGGTPTEDQVLSVYTEALKEAKAPATPPAGDPAPAKEAVTPEPKKEAKVDAPKDGTVVVEGVTREAFLSVVRDGRMSHLEATLNGVTLPAAMRDDLRERLTARINEATTVESVITKEAITAEVGRQVAIAGKLAEVDGLKLPTGAKEGQSVIQVTKDRHQKVAEAFDDFFKGTNPMKSFRGLYQELTGDTNITGKVSEAVRLSESLNTSSFGEILGDSITRQMLAEYAEPGQAQWRGTIANVVPLSDFRTQRRMRFGGYPNLSTVGQGAPYPTLTSPTDEEATYSPAKRGGTEAITIEMIANDDVGAIRRIPTKLARAARQTLQEFVFDFLRTNATIYDGVALAAAGHGNNIVTSALSSSNLSTLRLRMKAQTDMSSGKKLGLTPRFLIIPNDLEELAFHLTMSDRIVPDSNLATTAAAAAPNFQRKQNLQTLVVDYWSDSNDYWVASSLDQTPLIEIGFWGGREEPELFVQDAPNQGSMFTNDQITWKIRHVYGGGVMDFRGFAAGIVP